MALVRVYRALLSVDRGLSRAGCVAKRYVCVRVCSKEVCVCERTILSSSPCGS